MTEPRTIVEKIWDDHVVTQDPGAPAVLAVDLHLVHEVTSPQAFTGLRARGLSVRRPGQTVATADHSIPTTPARPADPRRAWPPPRSASSRTNCAEFGIPLHGIGSPSQGIVHVIGPQLGLTQPGMTIVCGDSHTSTHGAFGALAFGIGTSEVEMVLATQTLLQRDPKTYEVRVDGRLAPGVSAKDIILALIARIGIGGGTGHVFEYRGEAIRALTMEQRMTICNMSIEGGARAGLIAPDDTTFEYLHGRPHAPPGAAWDAAVARWRTLPTDDGADVRQVDHDRRGRPRADGHLRHEPGHGHPDHQPRPLARRPGRPGPASRPRARARVHGPAARPGDPRPEGRRRLRRELHERPDQRPAPRRRASLKDRHVADGVRLMVVPGSRRGEARGRARGPGRDLQGGRRRLARGRLLDVHRDERRPAPARASTPSAPATATSRAARARADGRSSPRR